MPHAAELVARSRIIVCDFDGTLVDSNPIKAAAFAHCFDDITEHREEILAYCRGHHHTPRWEKFRYVYEQILKRPYTAQVAQRLLQRFSQRTTQQIIDAPERPGACAFLKAVREQRIVGLLSSTPHEVLLEILTGRGWQDLFDVVQGAPVTKAAWLRAFGTQHGVKPDTVLFIGDAREDAEAAREAGCEFLGVGDAGRVGEVWTSGFTDLTMVKV